MPWSRSGVRLPHTIRCLTIMHWVYHSGPIERFNGRKCGEREKAHTRTEPGRCAIASGSYSGHSTATGLSALPGPCSPFDAVVTRQFPPSPPCGMSFWRANDYGVPDELRGWAERSPGRVSRGTGPAASTQSGLGITCSRSPSKSSRRRLERRATVPMSFPPCRQTCSHSNRLAQPRKVLPMSLLPARCRRRSSSSPC